MVTDDTQAAFAAYWHHQAEPAARKAEADRLGIMPVILEVSRAAFCAGHNAAMLARLRQADAERQPADMSAER